MNNLIFLAQNAATDPNGTGSLVLPLLWIGSAGAFIVFYAYTSSEKATKANAGNAVNFRKRRQCS